MTRPDGDGGGPDGGRGRTRFYRLGLVAARRRWIILAIWVLAVAAAGPLLGKLTDRLSQGGFEVPGSQSFQVRGLVQTDFHESDVTDSLVLHSDTLTARDPEFKSVVEGVR